MRAMRWILAAVLGWGWLPAASAAFPERPIVMVVPFAAGGPTDTLGRLLAAAMSADLGRQITVENVGGAGGTLGAARVAKAAPDGYTLLFHNISQATSGSLYKELPYDPVESFAPIGLVADVPMTIVGRPGFPATDLKGVVDHLRANPGMVSMGHAGIGVSSYLCSVLLTSATGTSVISVSYKGTAPALTDLIGGQIDLLCDQTTNTTGHITAGTVQAYALTAAERLPTLPDLPTTAEAGVPEVSLAVWHGLYAPAGTPPEVIDRLSSALRAAIADEALTTRLRDLGGTTVAAEQATPQAHGAHLAAEIAKWTPILAAAGAQAN
jgi:tripartite-type tricarboxylate transporter receptor subunit TctC